ncbi:hypothetical protein MM236_13120 [Belliella sp. DSM 107340]|uniref:IPT/TIG domain-containing protein n=1 Tax=Belliella calami TaxID=2923436 RepID=A0ABS9UR88_9BACT|nr:hypothetical protein [Belliella calami]MCH7398940.1 hypothetical protein [Belliella calami]
MMRKLLITIGICFGLFACEEEKLPEVTNPRLSVAYIQEIDSTGVVFAANIIDIGKQEIIEHGFYYGPSVINILQAGDKIKKDGAPESFFELKATHSLEKGKQYAVVAFIKTAEGITHSLPTTFVSDGSPSFIFDRIEYNDKVYFNDTIRVYGKNLSPKLGTYKAKMNGLEARISALADEYFEFIIPDNLDIQFGTTSRFDFEISGKNLTLQLPFQLREPEFEINIERFINLSQPVVLKGKYLRSNPSEIRIVNNLSSNYHISGTFTDSTIVFEPRAIFPNDNPSIVVQVRGKEYIVENNFKLLPKFFAPNQVINSSFGEKLIIKGNNFNPYIRELNIFKVDNEDVIMNIHDVLENEVEIVFLSEKPLANTSFNLSVVSHGETSTSTVRINMKDSRTPIMDLNPSSVKKFHTIGNKLYYIVEGQINEIDILSKVQKVKAPIPVTYSPLDFPEIFLASKGKLYFSESINSDEGNFNLFYEYDPISNQVLSLPFIPSEPFLQRWSFSLGDYIYIGGGEYIQHENNSTIVEKTYRYNVNTKVWESFSPSILPESSSLYSFDHNGEIYGLHGNYTFDNHTTLFKYNTVNNQWIEIKKFSALPSIRQHSQSSTIGEQLFFATSENLYRLNMNTLLIEPYIIQGFDYLSTFHLGTTIGDSFYYPMNIDGVIKLIQFNPNI